MPQQAGHIVTQTIGHVLAILQEDLPADLRAQLRMAPHVPGMLSHLPYISISAESEAGRTTGLGRTIGLKRDRVDNSLIDLGYVTGDAGTCRFTLSLWALTRPQLDRLRGAVETLPWVHRERTWEAPEGTLNRTSFLRCRLDGVSSGIATPLPPLPPHITIRALRLNLRTGPSTSFDRVGRANRGDQFELLGRNEDGTWVQGCCFEGQIVWMAARFVETSIPLSLIPQAEDIPTRSTTRRRRSPPLEEEGELPDEEATRNAGIDAGTAILATTPPVTTVWRQDLHFVAHLEATQEPLVAAGEPIEEIRILRHLQEEDRVLDTERTRRFADHEEIVDEFPD